ncbi:unnamed protein product [Triticum turgidum subsp. durum]|uniref:Cyclopropane-fatty-acyl-phospholipid synthase n=1 Tax=Triticum turgidum subsp. durum TaxID=4567 RepID=A0A9R1REQ9_TRITD|nr:unnamed protein product [Triticum turgidum subsp. durum]
MVEWLEGLGVEMERSDMSFSVSTQPDGSNRGCEWGNGNGISSLLAQKANILKTSFWRMLREIFKFKNDALAFLSVQACGHLHHKLIKSLQSQLFCYPQLPTVKARLQSFVDKGLNNATIAAAGYRVLENDGSEETYDSVILGVHAPNALKVLGAEATHHELRILGACQYIQRDIYLHCDQNLMPQNSSTWSAWNFLGTTSRGFSVTYWLNRIQNIRSQMSLVPWIAGHGFHEDGLKAGKAAAQGLLGKKCQLLQNPKQMIPSWTEAGTRLLVARFFNQFISIGNLILVEEGGSVLNFGKACDKCRIKSVMRVHDPLFYWKVATEGNLGLAEAYINGCFSFLDKREGLLNLFLSNDFFSLFLDKSMTYSCAVFKMENESLEVAQQRKLSLLIDKAKVKRGHHVLDIGSGWGSLAIQAVKQTGCKYTGVTLSAEQHKYAERKVREAGLEDNISFMLCDYRQIPPCKYDAIISCGMIEHVGHEYMDEFFACCESYLAEDGILVLQFISAPDERYEQYRRRTDFIKEYIFPGGCLPSLGRVVSAMTTSSRFCIEHVENIGPHYYTTLMHWRDNFMTNKDQVLALGFDEKFMRIWEFYLIYSAAGFKSRAVGDYQTNGSHILPLVFKR